MKGEGRRIETIDEERERGVGERGSEKEGEGREGLG